LFVNVHTHALVLDGVFAEDGRGGLVFHPARPPGAGELDALVATLARRIHRLLVRRRVLVEETESDGADPWADDEPVLAGLAAASVQGRVALGPRAGAAIRRCGALHDEAPLPPVRGSCHAAVGGFNLDATVQVPPGARAQLRHGWSDGTTHLRFHPLELLERLASLTPRPRINLVLYYGVLAAHAAWRARLPRPGDAVVTAAEHLGAAPIERSARVMEAVPSGRATPDPTSDPGRSARRGSNWLWAQLMQRTFGFDVLACPRCGGRFRLVALIEHAEAVRRILRHLGLPTEVPPPRPARAPPRRPQAAIVERDLDAP
jgi:Putative transposase